MTAALKILRKRAKQSSISTNTKNGNADMSMEAISGL